MRDRTMEVLPLARCCPTLRGLLFGTLIPNKCTLQAVAAARERLRWDVRTRSRLRVTPRTLDPGEVRLGYVPFWVGYYEGRDCQLRARALHGVEGSVQTAQFSRELLRALEAVG
jgi:hypothetical protein